MDISDLMEQPAVRTQHKTRAFAGRFSASRALEVDFARPLSFLALAAAYVLSRAPFINIGYGTDPDAWRVALSGYWLWDHHDYYPSRLPGYPVPELASAAVIKGGWLATNSLTVLISLLGLWFFAQIVSKLQIPNRGLIVAGFAFTPLLWINSMTTMDYMWALSFLLGCYYFLLVEQTAPAGVFLGLASASRPTSLIFALPFVIYLIRDGKRGELRDFFTWMIAIPMFAYLPIGWKYGPDFLRFYDAKVGYLNVLRLLGKDTLGLIGSMSVLAAILLSLPRLIKLPRDFIHDKDVMLWCIAIAITVIVFLRLPHESAYLIPLYPFGFLLLGRYVQKSVLLATISLIVFAGFVDLTSPGDDINVRAFTHAHLGEGLVLSNRSTMKSQLAFSRDLAQVPIPNNTIVMIGFSYPQFAVLNRERLDIGILEEDTTSISQLTDAGKAEDPEHRVTYVWLLNYKEFGTYLAEHNIRITQDAARSAEALYDYRPGLYNDPARNNVRLIDIRRGPSGSAGTARTDR
ncbi:MAG: hypothetical protein M3P30_06570 [Chloroflexota bacterium]|nr:hypothetical protein [Chloroflexota bacterium]